MAKVKRFYFVRPTTRSAVVHRLYASLIDGNVTRCGLMINPTWIVGRDGKDVCRRCGA